LASGVFVAGTALTMLDCVTVEKAAAGVTKPTRLDARSPSTTGKDQRDRNMETPSQGMPEFVLLRVAGTIRGLRRP
jgi:hypothetical protein